MRNVALTAPYGHNGVLHTLAEVVHFYNTRDVLPRIGCPTLVLCGREDAWSPLARHEELARAIDGARLVAVPRCGHMSTMEQPAAVAAALAAWLAS